MFPERLLTYIHDLSRRPCHIVRHPSTTHYALQTLLLAKNAKHHPEARRGEHRVDVGYRNGKGNERGGNGTSPTSEYSYLASLGNETAHYWWERKAGKKEEGKRGDKRAELHIPTYLDRIDSTGQFNGISTLSPVAILFTFWPPIPILSISKSRHRLPRRKHATSNKQPQ